MRIHLRFQEGNSKRHTGHTCDRLARKKNLYLTPRLTPQMAKGIEELSPNHDGH